VHAGVIDANKLSNNENVRNCIFGKKYYIYVSIPGKPGMSVSDGLGFANNLPRIGNTAVDKKYYDWFAVKVLDYDNNLRAGVAMVAIV